jgi:anti-sigma regulatory factor (Ser/Thr protein kinase)
MTDIAPGARIAVYDNLLSSPRVVDVPSAPLPDHIDHIATQAYELSHAQGGTLPYTVIREIAENFIHAGFCECTVSILDEGNTLSFSDQGPGITRKDLVIRPGFTSATAEMKRYIRGVGSGLPIAREFLLAAHGTLSVEDNAVAGTVITISVARQPETFSPAKSASQTDLPLSPSPYETTPLAVIPPKAATVPATFEEALLQEKFASPSDVQALGMQDTSIWDPSTQTEDFSSISYQSIDQQTLPSQKQASPLSRQFSQPQQQLQQQPQPRPQQQPAQQPSQRSSLLQQPQSTQSQQQLPQQQLPQLPNYHLNPPPILPPRLKPREEMVLRLLFEKSVLGAGDLVEPLRISAPTATRLMQDLEAYGFVETTAKRKRILSNAGLAYVQSLL